MRQDLSVDPELMGKVVEKGATFGFTPVVDNAVKVEYHSSNPACRLPYRAPCDSERLHVTSIDWLHESLMYQPQMSERK